MKKDVFRRLQRESLLHEIIVIVFSRRLEKLWHPEIKSIG